MKKLYRPLIITIIFPYLLTLMVLFVFILPQSFDVFHNIRFDIVKFFIFIIACFIVTIVMIIIKGVYVLKDDSYTAYDLLKSNRNIKLIHIAAYICNFIMAIIVIFTVILMGLIVFIFVFNMLSITLTGTWGIFCILKLKKEQNISKARTILYILLQFIFCIDVISAVLLAIKYKKLSQF